MFPSGRLLGKSPRDNLDMKMLGIGVGEDNFMTSHFMLGSALCFTTMTTLHRTRKLTCSLFITIAQSSATFVPHILTGCYPCRGVPQVRESSLENLNNQFTQAIKTNHSSVAVDVIPSSGTAQLLGQNKEIYSNF